MDFRRYRRKTVRFFIPNIIIKCCFFFPFEFECFRLNLSVTLGSVAYQNCFIAFSIHASLSVLKLVLKSV